MTDKKTPFFLAQRKLNFKYCRCLCNHHFREHFYFKILCNVLKLISVHILQVDKSLETKMNSEVAINAADYFLREVPSVKTRYTYFLT